MCKHTPSDEAQLIVHVTPQHKNDAVDNANSEVLAQLATRLDAVVDRIRGVPLGQELAEIAKRLREEAANFTTGIATDLANEVARVCEEREEVRHAFARHVDIAAERYNTLELKYEKLCDKYEKLCEEVAASHPSPEVAASHPSPEVLRAELATALEEEAAAARAARRHLIEENAILKTKLETEHSSVRVLRAQLIGVQALKGMRGVLPEDSSADVNTCPLNEHQLNDDDHNTSSAAVVQRELMTPSACKDQPSYDTPRHPQLPNKCRKERKSLRCTEPLQLASARRASDFVGRDFVPHTNTQPSWRAELAAIRAVQA